MDDIEMDSDREVKRRKLDTEPAAPQQSSPAPTILTNSNSTSASNVETQSQSSPAVKPSPSAWQLWKQAKTTSKVYSRRVKAAEAGGLDNIYVNSADPSAASKIASSNARHQLDPLRNQRIQQISETGSSPRKPGSDVRGFYNRSQAAGAGGIARKTQNEHTKQDGEDEGDEIVVGGATARPAAQAKKAAKHPSQDPYFNPHAKLTKRQLNQLDRRKAEEAALLAAQLQQHVEKDADAMIVDGAGEASVRDHRASAQVSIPRKVAPQVPIKRLWRTCHFAAEQLSCIRRIVLEKSTQQKPVALAGLGEEYAKVSTLIKQTVTAGESNSMLLIGARGSGKSALVEQAIREQTSKHADDFHVVRLNGFLHTDDKTALREIWRQLGREMELGDNEAAKNYADTLTTLLALLSHPEENGVAVPNQVTKSVIFIMDEFELFAGHPRQTLLYNLFDIAQSRKAPIAILGLTTRIDVAESLEKRVKSRFSHRYVHVGLCRNLPSFEQACKTAMTIESGDLTSREREILNISHDASMTLVENANRTEAQAGSTLLDWNEAIEQLMGSASVAAYTRRLYYQTKSVPAFLAVTTLAMATLPASQALNTDQIVEHLAARFTAQLLQPADSKMELLNSLSMLQLALLVCAARLNAIYNTEVVSFVLAYEEYKTIASKAKIQASAAGALAQGASARVWGKDVARGAWETLLETGLVMEDGRAAGGNGRVDVGLEELGACGVDLGMWVKWCREI